MKPGDIILIRLAQVGGGSFQLRYFRADGPSVLESTALSTFS